MIDRIVIAPGDKRGDVHVTLHGDLGTIIDWMARTDKTVTEQRLNAIVPIVSFSKVADLIRACLNEE